MDVAEGYRREPGDADVDIFGLVTTRQLEIAAGGGTGADEDGIVTFLEKCLQAVDRCVETQIYPEVDNRADLVVENPTG